MLASRTAEAKEAFRADCSSANKLIHFINSRNRSRVQLSRSCSISGGESKGTPVSCDRTRSSLVSSLVTTPVSSSVSYSALSPPCTALSAVVRRRYPESMDEEKRTLSLDSLDRLQSSVEPELIHRRGGVLTGPVFSTPVRSSFRRRPRTIIGIPFGSPVEHKTSEPVVKDSFQHTIVASSMEHRLADSITPATSEDLQHTIIEVGEPAEATVEHLVNHEQSPTSQIQGKFLVNQSTEGDAPVQGPVHDNIDHDETADELILDPVHDWWRELLVITDSECMTYLQSKPILANPARRTRDTRVQRSKSTGCVQDLKSAVQSTVPRTAQQSAEETGKRLARIQNILEFQNRLEDSILQLSR